MATVVTNRRIVSKFLTYCCLSCTLVGCVKSFIEWCFASWPSCWDVALIRFYSSLFFLFSNSLRFSALLACLEWTVCKKIMFILHIDYYYWLSYSYHHFLLSFLNFCRFLTEVLRGRHATLESTVLLAGDCWRLARPVMMIAQPPM